MKDYIDNFYLDFNIRDYMDDDGLKLSLNSNFIDCSLGTNPFISNLDVEKAIKEAVSEINKYPCIQYEVLKEKLLEYWNVNRLDKDNIEFGSGTMGCIRNIAEILIKENTKVLGIAPQFPRFISEVELKKGKYEYYSLSKENNFRFEIEEFLTKISNEYSLISIENPNNPTGQIIDLNDIEKIVKKAREVGAIVIIDEAYGDYMEKSNSSINLVPKYKNLIVLRSASKFYGLPNHRIGYIFADKDFIKVYNKISLPFPFSDLSASIFINILDNSEKFEFTKGKTKEVKKKVIESLDKKNYLYTSLESPIFTIKSDKYDNLNKKLLELGIIAENCNYFIGLDDKYARIRITENYENLIKRLKEVL